MHVYMVCLFANQQGSHDFAASSLRDASPLYSTVDMILNIKAICATMSHRLTIF